MNLSTNLIEVEKVVGSNGHNTLSWVSYVGFSETQPARSSHFQMGKKELAERHHDSMGSFRITAQKIIPRRGIVIFPPPYSRRVPLSRQLKLLSSNNVLCDKATCTLYAEFYIQSSCSNKPKMVNAPEGLNHFFIGRLEREERKREREKRGHHKLARCAHRILTVQ